MTANNSSLPEVTGDAAILVDATSVNEIAAGIARVLDDPGLQARLKMEGPERARMFTWEQAATQLLAYYRGS